MRQDAEADKCHTVFRSKGGAVYHVGSIEYLDVDGRNVRGRDEDC